MRDAEKAQPNEAVLGEDAASVSGFLQWARREGVRVIVHLDSEAENDLKETFETLTKNVPSSEVIEARPELEGDDST